MFHSGCFRQFIQQKNKNIFNIKTKYHTGRFLLAADLQNPVKSLVNHLRPVWPPGM